MQEFEIGEHAAAKAVALFKDEGPGGDHARTGRVRRAQAVGGLPPR